MVFSQTPATIIDNNASINFTYLGKALENQWVSSILEDKEGFMWFATQNGLYKYDGYRFYAYKYNPLQLNSLPANWVRHLSQDKDGIFWLSTLGEGLVRFDQDKNTFKRISSNTPEGLNSTITFSTFVTSNNAVWVDADTGLFRKSGDDSTFIKIKRPPGKTSISETLDGQVILSIDKSIYTYNPLNNTLELLYQNAPLNQLSVNSKNKLVYNYNGMVFTQQSNQAPTPIVIPEFVHTISNVVNDKCVFIGNKHVYKYDFKTNKTNKLRYSTESINLSEINSLYLDQNDIIWIGTSKGVFKENKAGNVFLNSIDLHARRILDDKDGLYIGGENGLYYYSKTTKALKVIIEDKSIFSLLKTKEGIWAGDMIGALFFIPSNHNVTTYNLQDQANKSLKLYGLAEDKNGFLWVSSWEGIYLMKKNGLIVKQYKFNKNQDEKELKAIKIHIDRHGNLWIVTVGNGIYKVPQIANISSNKVAFNYKHYHHIPGDTSSLNTNTATDLHEDSEGNIWIGSDFGINRYLPEKDAFEIMKIKNEVFDKKVMAIETDANNLLWISTISNGIYVYNKAEESLINLRKTDGLLSNACLYTSSMYNGNELYFGTDKGIQIINPDLIITPKINKAPLITNLSVLGKKPLENQVSILNGKTINLNHEQTDIFIDFSLNDYRFPEKINYYYILENGHTDWRKAAANRVNYTNLNPGNYNFLLKASYQTEMETPIARLTIKISKPWYQTTLAYVLFALVLALLILLFFQLRFKQKLASDRLKVVEDLDRVKSNLFTNISHELRTPLTLISGPIEHQLSKQKLDKDDKEELVLVKQNTDRLLNLVNQLMDLARIDSGQLKLNVTRRNLNLLLNQSISAFQYQANKKNIEIRSKIYGLEEVWFDSDSIEKIVSNLLANAVKYSKPNTIVEFEAHQEGANLIISIINESMSLENKNLSELFKRFYQSNASSEGIGVGLALVKELVNLNKGHVIVKKINNDKILFKVTMPIVKNAFTNTEIKSNDTLTNNLEPDHTEVLNNDDILLIVEDEEDIRQFVKSIFKNNYKIIEATNGKQGLAAALKHIPNLIISDVMMPEMDGVALCKHIKNNPLTSHIPFVLLTAKVGEAHEISGLSSGADAYITKPFGVEKLKVRVKKLLESRLQLQEHYSKGFRVHPKIIITSAETEFLNRLQDVLNKNLTHSEFTSEKFVEKMLMSRTQLHRKLKALVNMSASEYIRSQRLAVAKDILTNQNVSVSEAAYSVGFNSVSYFIKCFKETYHKTPSQFLEE